MKIIIVLLVIAELAFGHIQPIEREIEIQPRFIKEKLEKISECVQNLIQNGKPEIGLSVIDPLALPDTTLDLGDLGAPIIISGHITVKNFVFKDWSRWTFPRFTEKLTLIPPGMKIGVTLLMKNIEVDGEYDIDVTVLGTTIKGKGKINGFIKNAKVDLDTHVTLAIKIKNMSIIPNIEATQLTIDELVIDGDDYSQLISAVFPMIATLVNDNAQAISDKLSAAIIEAVNNRPALTADGKPDDVAQIIEAFTACIKL